MTADCPSCDPFRLPDPVAFLEVLDRRRLLVSGPDLVVVTRTGTGAVLGSAELTCDLTEDWMGELVGQSARRAGAGARVAGPREPDKVAHLVRRRRGRTVPRPRDFDGWTCWLNASNHMDACCGQWFLVTEHGWRSLLTRHGPAGSTPALRPAPAADLRVCS